MKKWFLVLLSGFAFHSAAMARDVLWTAHINAAGEVARAWPAWIERVEHTPQDNYFSQYKLHFNKRIVHQDPGFCAVSAIDASSEQRLVHGHAKVVGKPTSESVTVITQLVDVDGPSGDNSMEFLLMCTR